MRSITVGCTLSHKGSNKIKSLGSYELTAIGDLSFRFPGCPLSARDIKGTFISILLLWAPARQAHSRAGPAFLPIARGRDAIFHLYIVFDVVVIHEKMF